MSSVDFLERLLDGAVVVWKPLGMVAEYVRGLVYNKSSESSDGLGYKVLRANNITLASNLLNFDDVKVVNFDTKVKDSQKLYKNDIFISAASGSREHVGKVAFIDADLDFYFGGFMGVVRCGNSVNSRYLFHVFTSDIFQKYLDEMLNSSTINNLNSTVMGEFKIPIPCPENPKKSLEIQAEIVRILDSFTELTTELITELITRKKQYKYYRHQLLSFEHGDVEWKTLGEVCDVHTGGEAPASDSMSRTPTDIFKYPIYGNGAEVYGYTNSYKINKDATTISSIGANTGTVYFRNAYFTPIIRLKVLMPRDEKILPRYLFHALSSISIGSKSSSVPNMNAADVKRISIPIPSLAEQARIVAILDKFDALTNSITEGLPREIELRQKQYAHYRDVLLSFPKPQEVVA
jgi:type I restriction enzyme S subunit